MRPPITVDDETSNVPVLVALPPSASKIIFPPESVIPLASMMPLFLINNLLKGGKKKEKKETNVFDEIKMPDLDKEIRKNIEIKDIPDFIELCFENLNQILS